MTRSDQRAGGAGPTRRARPPARRNGQAISDRVLAADSRSLTTPVPQPINHTVAASANGRVFVLGGQTDASGEYVDDVFAYDPATEAWSTRAPMPTARNHLAVGAIDGLIYVAGGRFGDGFSSDFTDTLEIYDPATNTWSAGAPMPTPRSGVNGIGVGGCFYVWGGEWAMGVFARTRSITRPRTPGAAWRRCRARCTE